MNTRTAVSVAPARSGQRPALARPRPPLRPSPAPLALAGLLALPGLLGIPGFLGAQQGTVTYTHSRKIDFEPPPGVRTPPGFERMRESLPSTTTRTVTLKFTPSASLMTAEPGDAGDAAAFGNRRRGGLRGAAMRRRADVAVRGGDMPPGTLPTLMGMFGRQGGDQVRRTYVSYDDGTLVETREFMGRTFRVTSPAPQLEWRMTSEQAEHLGRMVIRATATVQRDVLPGAGGRGREGGGRGQGGGAEERERGPDMNAARTREIAIEAWFAPEIPVQGGPAGYGGLPGMILVLSEDDGGVQYAATEIALHDEGAVDEGQGWAGEVSPPDEGDELTREEYEQMVREKLDELRRMRRPPGAA